MHFFRFQFLGQRDVTSIAQNLILYTYCMTLKMEEEIGTCDEGGNRSSPAPEEPLGILQLIDKLEDVDGTCDEGGNRSSPAPEEPPGILQLIDQLENIVDTLLLG